MKKIVFLSLVFLIALLFLSACSSTKDNAEVKQINIGYLRVPNDETIAMEKSYIKEFFDSKGIAVNFVIVDSGIEANQAFASKSLDFASMGHTNGVVSLSKGLDTELVWIHELLGSVEGLAVRQSKNIKTPEDLAGYKVATTFSSTSHYILLNLLKEYGLEGKVDLLDMQTQDIVAAWQRGDIDAAYTWEPGLSKLLENGGEILINSEAMIEKGYITANIALARKSFAQANPDLIVGLLQALNKGSELYRNAPEDAIAAAAKSMDLTVEDTRKQMQGSIWLSFEDLLGEKLMGTENKPGAFVQVMKDTADFMLAQRAINKSPSLEEFSAFINSSYAEKAFLGE